MEILNNQLTKLSLTFLIGFGASYFVFGTNNEKAVTSLELVQIEPVDNNQTRQADDSSYTAAKKYASNTATSKPQKSIQQLQLKIETLQEQVASLKQKLVAREEHEQNKNTFAQQSNPLEQDSDKRTREQALKKRLRELQAENNRLKENLSELQPQRISYEQLIAAVSVPKQFEERFKRLKGKMREEIYDFHQKEEDLNWGADKQLAISDFIQTHENGSKVTIASLICKINTCELMLEETTNLRTLIEEGMPPKEAIDLLRSREPFFRQILRDLAADKSLNLRQRLGSASIDKIYAYLIEKPAVDQQ